MLPLRLEQLCFEAGKLRLLENINVQIDNPGVTVLIGPNGAGKSLLLRTLHGLIKPTRGRVSWNGQPPNEAVRRRQAMVFQRPVLLRRSVLANIEFVLHQRGIAMPPDRVNALLERVGLQGMQERPARRLSGGEQQRLALARALALEPEVLLMDEPTASLDPTSTQTIETIVGELKATGAKVIYVTHDIGQARRLADEVLFLYRGKLLEQSNAATFFNQTETEEARHYLAGDIVL